MGTAQDCPSTLEALERLASACNRYGTISKDHSANDVLPLLLESAAIIVKQAGNLFSLGQRVLVAEQEKEQAKKECKRYHAALSLYEKEVKPTDTTAEKSPKTISCILEYPAGRHNDGICGCDCKVFITTPNGEEFELGYVRNVSTEEPLDDINTATLEMLITEYRTK